MQNNEIAAQKMKCKTMNKNTNDEIPMMNLKTQKMKCKTMNKNTNDEMQGNVFESTEDEMLNKDLKEHKRLSLKGKKLTKEKASKPQNGSYKRKGTGTTLMRK